MTDIVKSVSIENMVNQRTAVVSMILQAHHLLREADKLAKAAHLNDLSDIFSPRTRIEIQFLKDDGPAKTMKFLDSGGWRYLMNESGMRSLMDATARKKWDDAIMNGDYPELTSENIRSTFSQLHTSRGDMFERGVIEVFRRLSWKYRTNTPVMFGKKIIIQNLLRIWGPGGKYASLNHSTADELDDLVRVFSIMDSKPEPDHRSGMYAQLSKPENDGSRVWGGEYFALRWYKKGTAHLTFKRMDLVDEMNRILAKHHPNALAADNR